MLVSICSILIPAVLLGAIVMIVLLLVSLARQGDERRRMIRDRACICTFYISLGVLIADTLRSAILVYVDGMESNTPSVCAAYHHRAGFRRCACGF